MKSTEIKIGGLGGQGVILAGMIVGRAATIFDDKFATLTQSFGPEARGSACSAQIIVADEPIEYPYVTQPEILVVMSREACTRFVPELAPTGTLIYEAGLVKPPDNLPFDVQSYGVPATRIAEDLRKRMVANIVMVGFFAAVTDVVNRDALRKSVEASVPAGTEELNLLAFEQGFDFGKKLLAGKAPHNTVSSTHSVG